ncbi:unnamed protein product [Urochloa humidicola]
MTAKGRRNKGNVDRDVTKEQRTNRRNKLQSPLLSSGSDGPKHSVRKGISRGLKEFRKFQARRKALADFEEQLFATAEERFGRLPDPKFPINPFKEKQFGGEVLHDKELCPFSVVSVALFDGDCVGENMLYACSGITLPHGSARLELTRFLTSAHLVREFNQRRNRDDKLRVQVCLPDGTVTDGLLGLYDKNIAIVTSIGRLDVRPVDLNRQATPDCPDHAKAAGRAFKTGCLMAMQCSLSEESPNMIISDSQCFTEAALGGPLVGEDGRFHGMIVDLFDHDFENRKSAKFLSQKLLCERLELFEKFNSNEPGIRSYMVREAVQSIVPSGFMKSIYRLRLFGYPMPPPLVLELNGRLLNPFEECFGELRAWKGYPGAPHQSSERVWEQLQKGVVANISRRVVSLASFDGFGVRSFACTGLLIKWPGSKASRTVVLTSASLVRSRFNEDHIDDNLSIDVFLPPNQRKPGTLEFYNLHYNIAIVSVKSGFSAIHPEDIFNKGKQVFYKKAIAIGRDPMRGLLMGTIGEVRFSNKDCKLRCKDLHWSTCKIRKAGIGGPLINFDGSFVGMNFYDGSSATPFLPRRKVVDALRGKYNFELPSEREVNPVGIRGASRSRKLNKWPVPKPYWFHGALDVDMYDVPKLIGRTLQ